MLERQKETAFEVGMRKKKNRSWAASKVRVLSGLYGLDHTTHLGLFFMGFGSKDLKIFNGRHPPCIWRPP